MESQNPLQSKEEFVASEKKMNYTGLIPVFVLLIVVIARISYEVYKNRRQKTRSPQERRVYVGSRRRPSFTQPEPTIFVSPNNLPPPPKYEAMAPPSYEEVVGIHYPQFQIQPITQPITTALAHTSSSTENNVSNVTNTVAESPATVITVTSDERRTSVTVATSS